MCKKLPVGGGAGGKKNTLCKKISVYISHVEEGEKKRALCKKQSVKKNYQLAGGPEERMHFVKKLSCKKNTHSHACFPFQALTPQLSGLGEIHGG